MADGDSGFEALPIPSEVESAAQLIQLDLIIQKWAKKVDAMAEKALEALPERTPNDPDRSCELGQAAMRVKLPMKSVHAGQLKVVMRVVPRHLEHFVMEYFVKLIEGAIAKLAAKAAFKKVPFIGQIVDVAVGVNATLDEMDRLEAEIHDALGCDATGAYEHPMRYDFNEVISDMKARTESEPRPTGPVRTRHK